MGVWYATREDVKSALQTAEVARVNALVDRAVEAASRSVEGLLRRTFYPLTATRTFTATRTTLWLDQHALVSVSSLSIDGTAVSSSDYDLEPANSGPPYNRITLPRSGDVSVTGVWGYTLEEATAGALAAAVSSTSAATVDVSDSSAVGVGSVLKVDSERLIVTEKAMLTTGQTLQTPLTASTSDVTVNVTTGTAYVVGETILLDSERMLVVDIAGNALTVRRAFDGTVLATHAGSTIYAPRRLTVTRGALGTTAATHSNGAAVSRWVVPGLLRELTIAECLNSREQEESAYARVAGAGDTAIEVRGQGLSAIRADAMRVYGRQARNRAV